MSECATCGNIYDKAFEVILDNRRYTFDCFECAIHKLAPRCDECAVRILGHGLESNGRLYCSNHCAEQDGVTRFVDRVE